MPTLTVIAGPNGSGKSTLLAELVRRGLDLGEYLNADDIAVTIHGPAERVSREAQQIVRERREAALRECRDHAFETVMSHPSHIEYMSRARAAGCQVNLLFVATEHPHINLDRVANRVLHGGHDVPPDRVISRYSRCLAQLAAAIATADVSRVFDNSRSDTPLREIALIDRRPTDPEPSLRKTSALDGARLFLTHLDIARLPGGTLGRRGPVDLNDIPAWWLDILLSIKPEAPFEDGPLP